MRNLAVGRRADRRRRHAHRGRRCDRPVDFAGPFANRHLDLAAAIVEIGTPPRMKRLGVPRPQTVGSPAGFAAIPPPLVPDGDLGHGERRTHEPDAQAYLDNARALFPPRPGVPAALRNRRRDARLEPPRRRSAPAIAARRSGTRRRTCARRWSSRRIGLETRLRLGRVLCATRSRRRSAPAPDGGVGCARRTALVSRVRSSSAVWKTRPATRPPPRQLVRAGRGADPVGAGGADRRQRAAASRRGTARRGRVGRVRRRGRQGRTRGGATSFGEYWRIDLHLNALRRMGPLVRLAAAVTALAVFAAWRRSDSRRSERRRRRPRRRPRHRRQPRSSPG